VKSKISADFIYSNNKGVVIMTNEATAAASDLSIILKYIKEVDNRDSENISCS